MSREVTLAGFDLDETFFRQDVGRQRAAHHTGGVDTDRPFPFVDLGARRVSVNYKRRTGPEIRPSGSARRIGAFGGPAVAVDHLNARHHFGRLFLPRLIREESPMHANDVELGLLKGEGHGFEIFPVFGAQFFVGRQISLFDELGIAGAVIFQEPPFVVAEERDSVVLAGEVEDFATVGAAVDQVTDEHEAIGSFEFEAGEQLGEFGVATVDVADGDESPVHAAEKC